MPSPKDFEELFDWEIAFGEIKNKDSTVFNELIILIRFLNWGY